MVDDVKLSKSFQFKASDNSIFKARTSGLKLKGPFERRSGFGLLIVLRVESTAGSILQSVENTNYVDLCCIETCLEGVWVMKNK